MSKIISIELKALDELTPTLTKAMSNLKGVSDFTQTLKSNIGKLNNAAKLNLFHTKAIKDYQSAVKAFEKASIEHQKSLSSGVASSIAKTSKALDKATLGVEKYKDKVSFSLKEFGGDLDKALNHFRRSNEGISTARADLEGKQYRGAFLGPKKPSSKMNMAMAGFIGHKLAPMALAYGAVRTYKHGDRTFKDFERSFADVSTVYHAGIGGEKYNQIKSAAMSPELINRGVSGVEAAHILKLLGQNEYGLNLAKELLVPISNLISLTGKSFEEITSLAIAYNAPLSKEEFNREPKSLKEIEKSTKTFVSSLDAITQMFENSALDIQKISDLAPGLAQIKDWKISREQFMALAAPLVASGETASVVGNALNSIMVKLSGEKATKILGKNRISIIDKSTGKMKDLYTLLVDIKGSLKRKKETEITPYLQSLVDAEMVSKFKKILEAMGRGDVNRYLKLFTEDVEGQTEKRAKIKQDTTGSMEKAGDAQRDKFFNDIGELFEPFTRSLEQFRQDFYKLGSDLISKFESIFGKADFTNAIGLLGSAVGGLLTVGGLIASIINPIIGVPTLISGLLTLIPGMFMLGNKALFKFKEEFINGLFKNHEKGSPVTSDNKTINIYNYGVNDPKGLADKIKEIMERKDFIENIRADYATIP